MPEAHSPQAKKLLIISQVYVPDPASVGQHMHDAAVEMSRRGYRVVVLASQRGYEDPAVQFPAHEQRDGVEIVRLPFSSFGKKTMVHRLFGQLLFLAQCALFGLRVPALGAILVSTSPPMASLAALVIRLFRRVPVKFWVMDINPDQALALGRFKPGALAVRAFNLLNRAILNAAADVVVLDRFMATRILAKRNISRKLTVLPPWPHENFLEPIAPQDNPFRARHHLAGKFVFMYSGNMSLASPLTTILGAALRWRDDPRLFFLFIGGGLGKREVEETIRRERPANMACLPYQPLDELRYSLSAADVHLVTLGTDMVGIIHPCKIYGAMAVGRPILLVGPQPSHVIDILEKYGIGWQVSHGDVTGAADLFRRVADTDPARLHAMGQAAREAVRTSFSKDFLCRAFGDVLERGLVLQRYEGSRKLTG